MSGFSNVNAGKQASPLFSMLTKDITQDVVDRIHGDLRMLSCVPKGFPQSEWIGFMTPQDAEFFARNLIEGSTPTGKRESVFQGVLEFLGFVSDSSWHQRVQSRNLKLNKGMCLETGGRDWHVGLLASSRRGCDGKQYIPWSLFPEHKLSLPFWFMGQLDAFRVRRWYRPILEGISLETSRTSIASSWEHLAALLGVSNRRELVHILNVCKDKWFFAFSESRAGDHILLHFNPTFKHHEYEAFVAFLEQFRATGQSLEENVVVRVPKENLLQAGISVDDLFLWGVKGFLLVEGDESWGKGASHFFVEMA